ncbi:MAG TPA: P-loop NTPase fold protein, partial [Polyangiaceae bacterium]|nr:P-loop NTPase fold protein [Polyangiaceae bacterium]
MEAQQPHVSVGVSDVEQDAEHRLSASLRAALNLARAIAQEYRVPGEIGTGLLLVAIVRTGRAQPKDASGPAELMKLIDSLGTHSLGSACDEFLERERRSTSGGGPRYDELSPNLNGVLEAARHLPNHDGILAMRHVIVSLLTFRPRVGVSNAHRILDQAGVQRATVHETFVDSLAARGPEPERDGWRALRPSASRPSASRTLRPEYWADVPSGRAADDCLNLDATVSAVANLFASPELDGSLSLGVFGNWGSGKSFFMRRLRLAIDELTAQARAQAEPWATPVYWPNIVQVEFNAWHYVDSNLWASLVAHLLQQLRDFKPGERSETQRTQLQKALSDLNLAADLHAAAERARAVAADAREVAERSLKKAEEDATEAERSLAAALGRSLWSYVEEE